MDQTKFVLKSRTIAAQIVAIVGIATALAAQMHVALPAWMAYINQNNADLIVGIIAQAAAIYFRFAATKTLTVVPTTPAT